MKGRKPTPLNMRLVQGNAGKRPIPEDVPEPAMIVSVPEPPELLSLAAREYWPQFAEQLSLMRVLTDADFPALCMLCEAYSIYWEAMEGVRQFGIISMTPNKYLARSEYLNTANKELEICLKILTEFGLTPSSRMRVRAT